jgi:DNA-binding NarL/FixJ family response regulator
MIRILIADDSPPVRRGLRTLLGLNSDWQVCGEAVDGADAVEKGATACSRPHFDGLLDAADGRCTSSPRNRKIW